MSVQKSHQLAGAKRAGGEPVGTPPAMAAVRNAGPGRILPILRDRVLNVWMPGLSWAIARTGRPGLAGMALLGASAVFFFSTHGQVTDEVRQLRADLDAARARAAAPPTPDTAESPQSLRNLPARAQMPQVLELLLKQADDAQLSIDTAKYELSTTKAGSLVRYRLSFPVAGPYTNVRQFLDSTLTEIPEL